MEYGIVMITGRTNLEVAHVIPIADQAPPVNYHGKEFLPVPVPVPASVADVPVIHHGDVVFIPSTA